jgi:hypothetical protein
LFQSIQLAADLACFLCGLLDPACGGKGHAAVLLRTAERDGNLPFSTYPNGFAINPFLDREAGTSAHLSFSAVLPTNRPSLDAAAIALQREESSCMPRCRHLRFMLHAAR